MRAFTGSRFCRGSVYAPIVRANPHSTPAIHPLAGSAFRHEAAGRPSRAGADDRGHAMQVAARIEDDHLARLQGEADTLDAVEIEAGCVVLAVDHPIAPAL